MTRDMVLRLVTYWDNEKSFTGLVEDDDGKTVTIQPLPAINGPLPAKIKRKAKDIKEQPEAFDAERVLRRIDAAKKVSAARSVQTRAAFDKVKERLAKIPKPAKDKKVQLVKRYKLHNLEEGQVKPGGWAAAVVKAVGMSPGMSLKEIEEKVKAPESKMSTKVAVAWYANDLVKKEILEVV